MSKSLDEYTAIRKLLSEGSKNILIISHRNPDGDAIGASLGLANLLQKLKHEVNVLVPNKFPAFLNWMKNTAQILVYSETPEKAIKALQNANIVFTLDFNDLTRVREFDEHLHNSTAYKILIDHHPDPAEFADLTISDTSVSSTAELVFNFIVEMGLADLVDPDIADCIYAGIMTDTGCFSFNSSTTATFKVVGELLKYGVHKDRIYDLVYDNFTYERMRLMGYCLDQKMKYISQYKTAYISLTQEEMRKYNFRIGDSEGFVNLPLSVKGVRFSALFTEKKDMIKISLRSKGNFDVNRIASRYFNGGGHFNAAGGETYDSLEKTIKRFENLLPEYKDELLS